MNTIDRAAPPERIGSTPSRTGDKLKHNNKIVNKQKRKYKTQNHKTQKYNNTKLQKCNTKKKHDNKISRAVQLKSL